MIAPLIADALNADAAIAEYTTGVYTDNAPIGAKCPYVVITAEDSMEEDDVVAIFDVEIDIYDYDEDKRPMRRVSKRIKDLLNFRMFDGKEFDYLAIRVWFRDRQVYLESDSTLGRVHMRFNARAIEDVEDIEI